MPSDDIDDVDRGILHCLQQNARDTTTSEIADEVAVSPGTVRNRIERLEDAGVIKSYVPDLDYERAGYQLHILFTCTAESQPGDEFVERVLDLHGVVTVRRLLAGEQNLHVEAIGTDTNDVSNIAANLEAVGLDIVRSEVLEDEFRQPFNHFGREQVEGE